MSRLLEQTLPEGGAMPFEAQMEAASVDVFMEGQRYFSEGIAALDNIAYGEMTAKKALLVGYLLRTAVLLGGDPGGAKSLLSEYSYLLFSDLTEDDQVKLTGDNRIQPVQIIGGSTSTRKITEGKPETTEIQIDGHITPNMAVLWADELPRMNSEVTNSMLSIPEEYSLKINGTKVPLPRFQVMITTANAAEDEESAVTLSKAMAARHALGAIMGDEISFKDKVNLFRQIKPDRSKIEPVMATTGLDPLRAVVKNPYFMPIGVAEYGTRVTDLARQTMKTEFRISEKGRMLGQVGGTASALGLFEGKQPDKKHVDEALRYMVAARLGALIGYDDNIVSSINEVVNLAQKAA